MYVQELSTFLTSAEKYVDFIIPVKNSSFFFQAACIKRIQARPTNVKTTRNVRTLEETKNNAVPSASLAVHFCLKKKTGTICLDCLLQGSAEAFSLWDGCSVAGAALEDKGPGCGARRWVGVQVLTGLFGHDQLVFRLPVDHRFPVAHLHKRAAGDSKQPQSHRGLHHSDSSDRFALTFAVCVFQIGRVSDRTGTKCMYTTCMPVCFDAL